MNVGIGTVWFGCKSETSKNLFLDPSCLIFGIQENKPDVSANFSNWNCGLGPVDSVSES